MTMNDVYEISTPNGDIKEIEIDGKTAWERAVDETKTGATPIIANATRGGNVSAYQIWGNAPYQEHTPSPDNPCEVKGVGERTKNLLDISADKWIKRIPADDVIVEENTVTIKADYFDYVIVKLKPNTDYYIKWKSQYSTKRVGVAIATVFNGKYATVIRNASTVPFTFNTAENTEIAFLFYAGSGAAGETKYSEIMLNEGSEPLPYEPYGYEIPVVSRGKNLCRFDGLERTYDFGKVTVNEGTSEFVLTTTARSVDRAIPLGGIGYLDAGTYTISVVGLTRFTTTIDRLYIATTTDSGNVVIKNDIVDGISKTFTLTEKTKCQITAVVKSESEYDNKTIKVQIEEGITATEYEPYREPISTTIYSNEPYFTNDYIRKDSTGGVEHREWGVKVFDGSEKWNPSSAKPGTFFLYWEYLSLKGASNKPFFCSHAVMTSDFSTYKYGECFSDAACSLYITKEMYDVRDFMSYLKSEYDAGHPVTIYYQLATPTDTEKDLPEILLVNGYNGIDTDTQIKPEKISVTYLGKDGN